MSQSKVQWSVDVYKKMKLILFDMFLNPSFKMTTSFANIARATTSTSKLNTRKYFKYQELDLYMKNNF